MHSQKISETSAKIAKISNVGNFKKYQLTKKNKSAY